MKHYEVVAIGSGVCVSELIVLKRLKKVDRVAVIEPKFFGGACINEFCFPLQYLRAASDLMKSIKNGYYYGVVFDVVRFDYLMFLSHLRDFVKVNREKVKENLQEVGIDVCEANIKEIDYSHKQIYLDDGSVISYNILIEEPVMSYDAKVFPDNHVAYWVHEWHKFNRQPSKVVIYGNNQYAISLAFLFSNLANIEVFLVLSSENDILSNIDYLSTQHKRALVERLKDNKVNVIFSRKFEYKRQENTAVVVVDEDVIEYVDLVLIEPESRSYESKADYVCDPWKDSTYHLFAVDGIFDVEEKDMAFANDVYYELVEGHPQLGVLVNKKLYDKSKNLKKYVLFTKEFKLSKLYGYDEKDFVEVYVDSDKRIVKVVALTHNAKDILSFFMHHIVKKEPFDREVFLLPSKYSFLRKLEVLLKKDFD